MHRGYRHLPLHDRRSVLAALAASAVAGCSKAPTSSSRLLRVLSWEGYNDPQFVRRFERSTGATVKLTYVYSVDEISAKLTASGGRGYDLVAIESSSYRRLIGQKLLQPIEEELVPRLATLLPQFADMDALRGGDRRYGIPYAWGSIPMIYKKAAFATPPDSWAYLSDSHFKEKVIGLDDANNNIVTAAIALGFANPFDLSDTQFTAIKDLLLAQKRNMVAYYAGFDEGASIFAQGGLDLMFAMAEPQVEMIRSKGTDVDMVIPKEGAIGWVDCWAICAGATNRALAHQWLNAMLMPDACSHLSDEYHYGNSVDQAANLRSGYTYADRLTFLEAPESFTRRAALWNEVKVTPV